MIDQWQGELEVRFGLAFVVLDREYVARMRQERGFGVNPWTTHSRFLISHRLLIDEVYAGPLRDWLGELRTGALLVLDEAHHAAPSSGARYAIDSQITRAVRELAARFEHRLFLSATPHNGHSNSFSALLEILDPQRFCRGVKVTTKSLTDVMVRRLKEDVREVCGDFPKRRVVQVDLDGLPADAPELALPALLDQYKQAREVRLAGATKRVQAESTLVLSNLQHRLLSSIDAFARTLHVHRKSVERQWAKILAGQEVEPPKQADRDLLAAPVDADDDRAELPEEQLAGEADAQVEAASAATAGPAASEAALAPERALLERMTTIAQAARGGPDARLKKLVAWIERELCSGGKWNRRRLIIFTEWDDTCRWLEQQLGMLLADTDRSGERIAVFKGSTPEPVRRDLKRAFNADPDAHPVRILLATDAAREGLNLQTHCADLFHFDVPWNPSRLEQRNGRIDRKLQREPEVRCHYFFHRQRPEDRVLQVLVRKTDIIRRELGSLAPVVESRLERVLRGGIRRAELDAQMKEIDGTDLDADYRAAMEEDLEQARVRQDDLRAQVDALRTQLERSQRWIGLDEKHFRAAIDCSLGVLKASMLTVEKDGHGPTRFTFPPLDRLPGADPTWADTMDTLRVPRRRDQKPWEWRHESPIRPVVFHDTGTMEETTVHLHLEQRVVQRLLGRFLAQGFVHHDLSRTCLAQTDDAIPRVILLGRLCLFGPRAARLHEEIITVTARWSEPERRKKPLDPYARDAEARTLALLEEALLPEDGSGARIPATVRRQLRDTAGRDVHELLPHLEARGEELAADARKLLATRATREADSMREILEQQQKRVREAAKHYDEHRQIAFAFEAEDERRQAEANRRYWDRRLAKITEELETEPARVREVYAVRAQRIEPVGLVYLWPVTN